MDGPVNVDVEVEGMGRRSPSFVPRVVLCSHGYSVHVGAHVGGVDKQVHV